MVKHTAGPWFVTGHMTKYVEARIGGGIIQEVAAVGPTDADGGYGSQQEANARLIAAAPALLEALQLCAESMRDAFPNFDHFERPAYKAAVDAIAKATGGEEGERGDD